MKIIKSDELTKGWVRGVAFAMYYLIEVRDEPSLALELAREAGISKSDLSGAGVDTLEKNVIYRAIRKNAR